MEQNIDTLLTAVGSLVSGLLGAAYWLRKKKPEFAIDDKVSAEAKADIGIIGRLERQVDRLSEQNDILAKQVNTFQLEMIKLQSENNKLSLENNALREENLSLREEIIELRGELKKLTTMVVELQRVPTACVSCELRTKNG